MRNNRNRRKGENSGGVESGKISSFFSFLASCCSFCHGAVLSDTADFCADKRMRQVEETPKKGYYDPVRNGTL